MSTSQTRWARIALYFAAALALAFVVFLVVGRLAFYDLLETNTWEIAPVATLEAAARQNVTYNQLMREPDAYSSEYTVILLRGKVIQIIEQGDDGLEARMSITQGGGLWGDDVYLYTMHEMPKRLLEGDVIVFYARPRGLTTYETVTGVERELPNIELLAITEIPQAP